MIRFSTNAASLRLWVICLPPTDCVAQGGTFSSVVLTCSVKCRYPFGVFRISVTSPWVCNSWPVTVTISKVRVQEKVPAAGEDKKKKNTPHTSLLSSHRHWGRESRNKLVKTALELGALFIKNRRPCGVLALCIHHSQNSAGSSQMVKCPKARPFAFPVVYSGVEPLGNRVNT